MKFVYTAEGADSLEWDFQPGKLMNAEAEAIERLTGMTFVTWQKAVLEGSVRAVHGLLYVMLKRDNPALKYDQVVFCMDEIDFDFTPEERADIRDALRAKAADADLTLEEQQLLDAVEEGLDEPTTSSDADDADGDHDGPKDQTEEPTTAPDTEA